MDGVWQQLGIEPTEDLREIKRAYARRLKQCQPEDDPDGFQRLRAAYETVLRELEGAGRASRPLPRARPVPPPEPALAAEDESVGQPFEVPPQVIPRPPVRTAIVPPPPPPPDPTVQARRLVAGLLEHLARHGDAPAAGELKRLYAGDELVDLRLRECFERELLLRLTRRSEPPLRLLGAAAEMFGWDDVSNPLRHSYPRELELAQQAGAAADALAFLERIGRGDEAHRRGRRDRERRRAARFLLQPPDEALFRRHARRPALRAALQRLLDEAEQQHGPGWSLALDQSTLEWWRRSLLVPYLSGRARVILLLAVFVLVALVMETLEQRYGAWGSASLLAILVGAPIAITAATVLAFNRWVERAARAGAEAGGVVRRLLPLGLLSVAGALILADSETFAGPMGLVAYGGFAWWSGHWRTPLLLSLPALNYHIGFKRLLLVGPEGAHFLALLMLTVVWKLYVAHCADKGRKPSYWRFCVRAAVLPFLIAVAVGLARR